MDAKSLAEQLGEVQVIDVREPFEWEAGRIEGSRHIPMNQLPARLSEIDPNKTVVAVCFAGARSEYASQFLAAQGFQALNLDGGLKSWVSQGLALSGAGGAPGSLVHDPPTPGAKPAEQESAGKGSATAAEESENLSPEMESLKDAFIEVVFAAQERFGDEEPPEEEMRLFMKEWLMSKGKTDEEAEEILSR